ncbi:hypothetical protein BDZ45DRAFT_682458 [Acephala macrosclerotiorum]|nr:hypothetical protein BDZ45DRAFT_682458 [Acephala macrosclerotiorum]
MSEYGYEGIDELDLVRAVAVVEKGKRREGRVERAELAYFNLLNHESPAVSREATRYRFMKEIASQMELMDVAESILRQRFEVVGEKLLQMGQLDGRPRSAVLARYRYDFDWYRQSESRRAKGVRLIDFVVGPEDHAWVVMTTKEDRVLVLRESRAVLNEMLAEWDEAKMGLLERV